MSTMCNCAFVSRMTTQLNSKKQKVAIGRPPANEPEKQLEICMKYKDQLLTVEKRLKPRTDAVFESIANELKMTSAAVHLAISRKFMADIFGVGNFEQKEKTEEKSDDDIDYVYEHTTGSTVIVKIPDGMQNDFRIEETGTKRTYKVLAKGWTDVLSKLIEDQLKTGCTLNFSKANISHVGNTIEFDTEGKCSDCNSTVHIASSQNRTQLQIQIEKGTKQHSYDKYRRVTATRARNLYGKLQNDTVHNVFHEQTKTIPSDAENLPRDFVREKSLSNIKSRHGLPNETAINELRRLKYSAEYDDIIKEIATDPFCVIFWTKEQVHYYSQVAARGGNICISLDATGSLVTSASLLTDIRHLLEREIQLPHVFLYLISVKCDGKSTPCGQMLSAQQDSHRISYFFQRWLQCFKCPNEVVIDGSKALLKSCANSFASSVSAEAYIQTCFNLLNGKNVTIPTSFILDVAHFIKKLHSNKTIRKTTSVAKQFYLSCIGVIMQCTRFDEARAIVQHMVRLANGSKDAEESLDILTELIRTHETEFIQRRETTDTEENASSDETDETDYSDNGTWFDEILSRLKEPEPSEKIEPYFNPVLNAFFKKVFDRLPLWSAVMKASFKSSITLGTSNDTESRFNVIKNNVFSKQQLPIRPDSFIKTLVPYITSLAKLGSIAQRVSSNVFLKHIQSLKTNSVQFLQIANRSIERSTIK